MGIDAQIAKSHWWWKGFTDMTRTMRFKYYRRRVVWVCPQSHHQDEIWGLREHVCIECGKTYSENDIEMVDWYLIPIVG